MNPKFIIGRRSIEVVTVGMVEILLSRGLLQLPGSGGSDRYQRRGCARLGKLLGDQTLSWDRATSLPLKQIS